MTSQNHVIEQSSNFMSASSSWYVTTLLSLVPIGIVEVEMFLVCNGIKQYHTIKGSGYYNNRSPSM